MNNKIFTPGELVTIRTNLDEIEKTLGHPIPGGMVDMSELKDYILSPGEVLTTTENLRRVDRVRNARRYKSYNNPFSEALSLILIGLMALPILGIIELVKWISSLF